MINLLEAHNELAKKYADMVDQAAFEYIGKTIGWLKDAGEKPEDYELVMVSRSHIDNPLSTEWSLRIRKITERGIVD